MKLLYYLFIKPLSYLPYGILYLISDFLFFVLYYIVGYRKKVVIGNITNSFPDKRKKEIDNIAKKFYAHFCDLLIESINIFSISREDAIKRFYVRDLEKLNDFFNQNRSIIIVAGHFNNWELATVGIPLQLPFHLIAIYAPLSNKFIDKKMKKSRGKTGLEMVPRKEIKERLEQKDTKPIAVVFATDQSPNPGAVDANKVYWDTLFA